MKTQYTCTPDIERSGDITECKGSEGTRDSLKRLREMCGSVALLVSLAVLPTNTVAQVGTGTQNILRDSTMVQIDGITYSFLDIYKMPDGPKKDTVLSILSKQRRVYAAYVAFTEIENNKKEAALAQIDLSINHLKWVNQLMSELPGIQSKDQLIQYLADGHKSDEMKNKLNQDPGYANAIIMCIMVAMDLDDAQQVNR